MNDVEERTCPDCSVAIGPIRLIDKAAYGMHAELEYAVPESRRGFWTKTFPVAGRVTAYMCQQCGRILLYGSAGAE